MQTNKADRVLITGGLGYLGTRVAKSLMSSFHVLLGSRRETKPEWISGEVDLVPMDLFDANSLLRACKNVDFIIHLAALNEIECVANPKEAIRVSEQGTLNLLSAAVSSGVKRVIYLSTIHVYGSPLQGRITEETFINPLHPYASSHLAAEELVLATGRRNEIESVVIRQANGFGVPAHPSLNCWTLLVNDLCRQAVTTKKITLRSSGIQKRNFITLEDAARAVSYFLAYPLDKGFGLFNIGDRNLSVLEMAQMISNSCEVALGFRPDLVAPFAGPTDQTSDLDYCIDKASAAGFRLRGDFEKEIQDTLLFCRENF